MKYKIIATHSWLKNVNITVDKKDLDDTIIQLEEANYNFTVYDNKGNKPKEYNYA